ncbi:Hypothetical protein RADP37_05027 [Roseomonas mucosa]|uniref:Uncharacterized protein n=1 Tax=Roseomonas mucosa TaxID=207340 RepID=A0A4Y1N3I5_9PROT|nr:Hypothetical protein RADP37_05027 [Roseomonas mucosa]
MEACRQQEVFPRKSFLTALRSLEWANGLFDRRGGNPPCTGGGGWSNVDTPGSIEGRSSSGRECAIGADSHCRKPFRSVVRLSTRVSAAFACATASG